MVGMDKDNSLVVFQGKGIRRVWYDDEWWFVLEDIVSALTDSKDPKQYIKKMRQRDEPLSQGWVQIVPTLSVDTPGGKQKMNCVNTRGAFRIIQSIPSPKAEPFKRWLAKVGYERIREIEDPELAMKRMRGIYHSKGYSEDWIEKRARGIAVRDELTKEWSRREIKTDKEYSILTAEISDATFGMTPSQYLEYKGLKRENLRDHMTDLELIFTMLGEAATTEIARKRDARGFVKNKEVARRGGTIAGDARRKLEYESGKSVITPENYREIPEKTKKLLKGKPKNNNNNTPVAPD
ncbi:MAG: Bro-N domain-containing protein [Methanobacteriota archaeon]